MRCRRQYGIVISTIAVFVLVPAVISAKDISLTGMVRSYTGARISEGDVPVTEQTVDLTLEGWADKTEINVNPYAYIGADGEPDIGMREAYIDLFLPSMDIRLGKQAIVWGEAEGAFITDIVSPQDLRSFIIADFTEIRMGVPAIKADYYAGPLTFEAVWLPRFVPSEQPEKDSIWYYNPLPAEPKSTSKPDDGLDNSEVFGKISYFGSLLNAEIMVGYAWNDLPAIEGTVTSSGDQLTSVYERYTVVGGSFSTTIGSVVLRSEAAAYLDKSFSKVENPGPPQVLVTDEYDQLHGLVGADWSLFGVDLSSQYIIKYIHDYDSTLRAEEFEHTGTFRLRDSYFSDTLTWELFTYVGFDPEELSGSTDALLRPSLVYSIEEGVEIETGMELFIGDEAGTFGRFEENSLAYVTLRWYF